MGFPRQEPSVVVVSIQVVTPGRFLPAFLMPCALLLVTANILHFLPTSGFPASLQRQRRPRTAEPKMCHAGNWDSTSDCRRSSLILSPTNIHLDVGINRAISYFCSILLFLEDSSVGPSNSLFSPPLYTTPCVVEYKLYMKWKYNIQHIYTYTMHIYKYTWGQIHRPKPPHKDVKIFNSRGIEPIDLQSQQSDLSMGWSWGALITNDFYIKDEVGKKPKQNPLSVDGSTQRTQALKLKGQVWVWREARDSGHVLFFIFFFIFSQSWD